MGRDWLELKDAIMDDADLFSIQQNQRHRECTLLPRASWNTPAAMLCFPPLGRWQTCSYPRFARLGGPMYVVFQALKAVRFVFIPLTR